MTAAFFVRLGAEVEAAARDDSLSGLQVLNVREGV